MKWFISTFLALFSAILGPYMAPQQELAPGPPPEPASSAAEPEPENTRLYVLMYHHFVPEGWDCNTWTVTDVRFREDLQWLADHGYETVLPSRLAAGEPLPPKAVMLTLDDGYASNYWLAYPLLQEFESKAVMSVVASSVDRGETYYLDWPKCQIMAQSGLVEIGSHTYDCHGTRGIKRGRGEAKADYEARVLPDLQASIDLIEENVGATPIFFAYPNGITDKWASGFIREHFSVTVTTKHGCADISEGLYGLKRCNVSMGVPLSKILPP